MKWVSIKTTSTTPPPTHQYHTILREDVKNIQRGGVYIFIGGGGGGVDHIHLFWGECI